MKKKNITQETEENIGENFPSKKQDNLNTVEKIQNYIQNNSKKVITYSIVIIAITALFFLIKNKLESDSLENKEEASVSLARILPYYNEANYEVALKGEPSVTIRGEKVIGLTEIVENYEGLEEGKVAALYAGNSLLNLNKFEESKKYFEIALKSEANTVLEGANAGMGVALESLKDYANAVKFYTTASELGVTPGSKNRYAYFAGICYEKGGNKDKAIEIYKDIILESASEYVGLSKARLVRLGTVIE
ncbi:MAG TPA: tetratricopeptide repeat protein [Candidatus Kapabacteria bacterium]|mgnify:FL=1|nr:tetratricopeptide repeat protein [Candidatus Kapabacteria bacterium]